jgi:tetratricopeptide (TPR) repeat protein
MVMKLGSSALLSLTTAAISAVAITVWHPTCVCALSAKDNATAYALYSCAKQRKKDTASLNAALTNINSALDIDPRNPNYLAEKASILFGMEEDEESLKVALAAIKIEPRCGPAWTAAGKDYERLGRLQEALAAFDTADKIEPNNHYYLENRAKVLVVLKRYAEAERCLELVLAQRKAIMAANPHAPNFNPAPFELGVCFLEQQKWNETIKNSDAGLKFIGPNDIHRSEYFRLRAEAYEGLKDYAHAIADYKQILKSAPDDRRTHQRILSDYEAMGDKANAIHERKIIDAFDNDILGEEEQREHYERTYLHKPN